MTREPEAVVADLVPAEGFLAAGAGEGPNAVEVCFAAPFCFLTIAGGGSGDDAGRAAEPSWAPNEEGADSPYIF